MSRRSLAAALLAAALATPARAHVGSPDVVFEGTAGPYGVLVGVRPPDVVPGTALVTVRLDRTDAAQVQLQPLYYQTGREGLPRPDEARPVPGDARLYSGQIWLMEFGSSSVVVSVSGAAGKGEVIVPVPALATARRLLPAQLGIVLALLGALLCAGAVALVAAASGQAQLAPGVSPVPVEALRRGRRAGWIAGAVLLSLAWLGQRWWASVDRQYLAKMYRSARLDASVVPASGGRVLRLRLSEPEELDPGAGAALVTPFGAPARSGALIPDHGKLMHLFLVARAPLAAMAHVHPVTQDALLFKATLAGELPAGAYRLFADVVHEDGLAETLTSEIELPAPAPGADVSSPPIDPDDAWSLLAPAGRTQDVGGATMTLEGPVEPVRAGSLEALRVRVQVAGQDALLEPYMGMLGHAAVLKEDGSVFIHLHPVGSVPMASQEAFARRLGAAADPHAGHHAAKGPLAFPYGFPSAGRYRVYVQVRSAGRVLTGAFRIDVS